MQVIKTKFNGLVIYKRKNFKDTRGFFRELFIQKQLKNKFVFDYLSLSKKNVIRGLHLQLKNPQGKLITVMHGKIFDVALDCRIKSKTFGKFFNVVLSAKENKSLYIPEGFAHGFCSMTENSILHYKCTKYRDKNSEYTIRWNDKDLKIKWPTNNPIISVKDKNGNYFNQFKNKIFK